jgi:hypothetical protein
MGEKNKNDVLKQSDRSTVTFGVLRPGGAALV